MKLTSKTKEAFEKWLEQQDIAPYKTMFWDIPEIIQSSYIIEFFDSVGIYICIEPFKEIARKVYFDVSLDFELYGVWSTRQEATDKAIEKANEIYNNKFA